MPIPAAIASFVDHPVTSRPFTSTFPASGFINPPSMRMSVDLPAPFSPTRAWISPGKTSSDAPRLARMAPKDLSIPCMQGIDKSFGAIRANRGASLEVLPGEIHALVGENGAGKSTLMRILGGLMKPDAGKLEVNGRDVTGWSTNDAIAAGIGMVHQHFMLVPTLPVAENLVLGAEPKTRGIVLDYKRAADDVRKLSNETGLVIAPERLISDLSVGEAQCVEILKVLFRGARILVLDE